MRPGQELPMALSDELAKLQALHQRGALTDDEFSRAKARLLDGAA
ncbi:MAG: SHOCT domain-containing protein, partial [Gemmatimonas sp.]